MFFLFANTVDKVESLYSSLMPLIANDMLLLKLLTLSSLSISEKLG